MIDISLDLSLPSHADMPFPLATSTPLDTLILGGQASTTITTTNTTPVTGTTTSASISAAAELQQLGDVENLLAEGNNN